MATELIILMTFVVTILVGVTKNITESFSSDKGAAPQLSARLEKQIEVGHKWINNDPNAGNWQKPK